MKPLNIKSKLKSFFTIPEEDLTEEECTKTFENQTWLTLSKNKIFYGILAFMLLIDILVAFNLNVFYIRAILAFLFITLVPGLLIMLMMKIREVGFWEYLVYTVGLSISFIMFGGLAVNWILPWLNITDKPLSLWPILICFNIFFLAFWIIAYRRNKDLEPFKVQLPKLDALNTIMFTIPIFFPILAVLGAFLLNNHGSNILTMIMLGGIAVYVFAIVLLRKKLNPNIYPWALYLMGLSLLLMYSMRSWTIFGWDSFKEYFVFQLAKNNSFWEVSSFKNNYNACLSITILPTIMRILTKFPSVYIFKLFFQIVFPFSLVSLYLLSQRYFNYVISFLISIFFIIPNGFLDLSLLYRQQIAFLFFSLMFLALFNKEIAPKTKTLLVIIFGFSVIVSHYSTSYITLALLLLTYPITLFSRLYNKNKTKKKINFLKKSKIYLTMGIILIILLLGFLWHSQITETSSNLARLTHNSLKNLNRYMVEELKDEDASLSYQFNPFYTPPNNELFLKEYTQNINQEYAIKGDFSNSILDNYPTSLRYSKFIPFRYSHGAYIFSTYAEKISKILIKLFIIFGTIIILLGIEKKYLNKGIDIEIKIFSIVFGFFLFLILFLPIISTSYDIGRLFQQILLILSIQGIFGGLIFFKVLFKKIEFKFLIILLIILLILVFLFSYGVIYQIVGGKPTLFLNNFGGSFDSAYSHLIEIKSAEWLKQNKNQLSKIYADRISEKKLFLVSEESDIQDILPESISKMDYVYAGYTNTANKIASKNYNSRFLNFNFPIEFLNENKNKIYSNGGSEIFK